MDGRRSSIKTTESSISSNFILWFYTSFFSEIEHKSQFEHPGLMAGSKKPRVQQKQTSHQYLPNTLAQIRQSASIQSILQQQQKAAAFHEAQQKQHYQSQPLPIYQPPQQYYRTESLNIITEGEEGI
jgi:hypothetical protein